MSYTFMLPYPVNHILTAIESVRTNIEAISAAQHLDQRPERYLVRIDVNAYLESAHATQLVAMEQEVRSRVRLSQNGTPLHEYMMQTVLRDVSWSQ